MAVVTRLTVSGQRLAGREQAAQRNVKMTAAAHTRADYPRHHIRTGRHMDKDTAMRRLVGKARVYVLVTRDVDAHLWEVEEAERQLDRAARSAYSDGASHAEIDRVIGRVVVLMEQADAQTANAAG